MDGSNDVYIYDESFSAVHVLATVDTDLDDDEDCFCLCVLCRGWRIFLGYTYKILEFLVYVYQVASLASHLYYAWSAYASHDFWYWIWFASSVLLERSVCQMIPVSGPVNE
jgi:hypothetical protein